MSDTSWLEINLERMGRNLAAIRQLVGATVKVCGVVKADAYGLGAVPIAQKLEAEGIDMLAVYCPDQARQLAEAGIGCPLLIFMPVRHMESGDALATTARAGKLHLTLHDLPQLEQLNQIGRALEWVVPVHVYVDTGMSRMGLTAARFDALMARLPGCEHVRVVGLYTHFAAAEDDVDFTHAQMDVLDALIVRHGPALGDRLCVHAANTFAVHRDRRFHQSMVRVGLGLYGYGPGLMTAEPRVTTGPTVQPIVRWLSRIAHVQRYPKGATVGYNRTFVLSRDSVIGIVPAGYADGYALALSNRSSVLVKEDVQDNGVACPLLGKVNMDQIAIDLTDAGQSAAQVGAVVELISADADSPCAMPKLAGLAGSSCYEMLCRLSSRLPRRYV